MIERSAVPRLVLMKWFPRLMCEVLGSSVDMEGNVELSDPVPGFRPLIETCRGRAVPSRYSSRRTTQMRLRRRGLPPPVCLRVARDGLVIKFPVLSDLSPLAGAPFLRAPGAFVPGVINFGARSCFMRTRWCLVCG